MSVGEPQWMSMQETTVASYVQILKGFEGQTAGARLYQKIVITGQADWKEVDLHFALAGGP